MAPQRFLGGLKALAGGLTCRLPVSRPVGLLYAALLGAFMGIAVSKYILSPAQSFRPPPAYHVWWQEVEQCSGLPGDMSKVSFGVMLDREHIREYAGYTTIDPTPFIVLSPAHVYDAITVKHEMLHAILLQHGLQRHGDHPQEYFIERCKVL